MVVELSAEVVSGGSSAVLFAAEGVGMSLASVVRDMMGENSTNSSKTVQSAIYLVNEAARASATLVNTLHTVNEKNLILCCS
jgi:hypothetical protein